MKFRIFWVWSRIAIYGESIYILLGYIHWLITMKFVKKYIFYQYISYVLSNDA